MESQRTSDLLEQILLSIWRSCFCLQIWTFPNSFFCLRRRAEQATIVCSMTDLGQAGSPWQSILVPFWPCIHLWSYIDCFLLSFAEFGLVTRQDTGIGYGPEIVQNVGDLRVSWSFFSLLKEGDQVFQKKLGTNSWEPINIYHHTNSNIGHQLFLGLQFFAADFPGSEAWTMLYTMLGCDGRWARA